MLERRDSIQANILRTWMNKHVLSVFSERILHIDIPIVQCCAKLHVPNPQSERDALIAATALNHGMVIVTRNVRDFVQTGVEVLNPWEA